LPAASPERRRSRPPVNSRPHPAAILRPPPPSRRFGRRAPRAATPRHRYGRYQAVLRPIWGLMGCKCCLLGCRPNLLVGDGSGFKRLAVIELPFEAVAEIRYRPADELLLLADASVGQGPGDCVDHSLFEILGKRQQDVFGADHALAGGLRYRRSRSSAAVNAGPARDCSPYRTDTAHATRATAVNRAADRPMAPVSRTRRIPSGARAGVADDRTRADKRSTS
jgi:hypothetical protein